MLGELDKRRGCSADACNSLLGRIAAPGPGCVKSPLDAMILRVNRQLGATDVRLR
jgi:hypothetical protein